MAAYEEEAWPPKRGVVAQLIATNLASLSFFWRVADPGVAQVQGDEAKRLGREIEERAFQAASAEAVAANAVKLYARYASQMMLEVLGQSMAMDVDADRGSVSNSEEQVFDISGGKRVFLTKEQAEELLRPLSAHHYTKICFSNKSFGKEAAEVAAEVLSKLKISLLDVDFADIVAGRPENEALEVMSILSRALEGARLRSLNLSDNALGEKGVRAFSALLKSQASLQELSFMNNGISKEAARAICETVPSGSQLKLLHFHNNMTGDKGAIALAKLVEQAAELENFRFSSTRVGEEGAVALASALSAGSKLKVLDLRDNMFDVGGGIALSKALEQHRGLTHVYLSDLSLGDDGSRAIFSSLANGAGNLKVLEVGNNEITHLAVDALVKCIGANKFLTKLNLSENELGDKGAVKICTALKNSCEQLEELDLSCNSLTRVGAVTAAEAVADRKQFKLLNIDGNCISGFGLDEVRSILKNSAAGISVLGPLEDNDEEGAENESEDDNEEEEEEDGLKLEKQLKGLSVQ